MNNNQSEKDFNFLDLFINELELSWNNFYNIDCSILFKADEYAIRSIPFDLDDNEETLYKEKPVLSQKISVIKKRLDLLGYNLEFIEKMYAKSSKVSVNLTGIMVPKYDQFFELLKKLQINEVKINPRYLVDGKGFGDYYTDDIFENGNPDDCEFYDTLHPFIALRILCERKDLENEDLNWSYINYVNENGSENFDELIKHQILIVTEGNTDTEIIKHLIENKASQIKHFFTFINMKDKYPFAGVGNMQNFLKGLNSINYLNRALFVFDNDKAGCETYNRVVRLNQKDNICVVKLPPLVEFNESKVVHEDKSYIGNINDKGVSIECFLDLGFLENIFFEEKADKSNIVIHDKLKIQNYFEKNKGKSDYNYRNLEILLDFILSEAKSVKNPFLNTLI